MTEADIRAMPDIDYMNDAQLAYFRTRLLAQRAEVLVREKDVHARLNESQTFADPGDRALAEEQRWLDIRLRDREAHLCVKIDKALREIRNHDYGWCEVTREAIGIPRLLARPSATICADVKVEHETRERIFCKSG